MQTINTSTNLHSFIYQSLIYGGSCVQKVRS